MNSKCCKCLKIISDTFFLTCNLCGINSHCDCCNINKKDLKTIKSNKNLFFKCHKCIKVPLQICFNKLREISEYFIENAPLNLTSQSGTAKSSSTNTPKLNTSRQILDTTRAQRIPKISVSNKRLSISDAKKVSSAEYSTPQTKSSCTPTTITKTNDYVSKEIDSFKNDALISNAEDFVAEHDAIVVDSDDDADDVDNNVAVDEPVAIKNDVADASAVVDSENVAGDGQVANTLKPSESHKTVDSNSVDKQNAGGVAKVVDVIVAAIADDAMVVAGGFKAAAAGDTNVEKNKDVFSDVETRKPRSNHLIGCDADATNTLPSVPRLRFMHISRLKNTVTEANVINFVASKLSLPTTSLICSKLVKKDVDITSLHFINFKLGVPAASFNRVLKTDMWPIGVQIKPFVSRPKNELGQNQQVPNT